VHVDSGDHTIVIAIRSMRVHVRLSPIGSAVLERT
jgi:hypothetical protein